MPLARRVAFNPRRFVVGAAHRAQRRLQLVDGPLNAGALTMQEFDLGADLFRPQRQIRRVAPPPRAREFPDFSQAEPEALALEDGFELPRRGGIVKPGPVDPPGRKQAAILVKSQGPHGDLISRGYLADRQKFRRCIRHRMGSRAASPHCPLHLSLGSFAAVAANRPVRDD